MRNISKVPSSDDTSLPVPGYEDLAAWFQESVFKHVTLRTHRAILYALMKWPDLTQMVGMV